MAYLDQNTTCRFLALPLELRLQIYQHLLSSSDQTVTFSSARLEGSHAEIVQRLCGDNRSPFPGLPEECVPRVEPQYDSTLLRVLPPVTTSFSSPVSPEELGHCSYSSSPSILLANKQIRAEVLQQYPDAARLPINIFLAYPHGLHVFDTIGSHLLRKARTIQIAGHYTSFNFDARRAVARHALKAEQDEAAKSKQSFVKPDSSEQLSRLITSMLGLNPQPVELHMRILYPGANSYSVIWGDNASPIVIALQSICAGEIQLEVWREQNATGVYLAARPSKNGKRTVRTVWRHFDDPRFAGKGSQHWEIDPRWPDVQWDENLEAETIVSSMPYSQASRE